MQNKQVTLGPWISAEISIVLLRYGKERTLLGIAFDPVSLKHKEVFISQLRAILRASKGHEARILFNDSSVVISKPKKALCRNVFLIGKRKIGPQSQSAFRDDD